MKLLFINLKDLEGGAAIAAYRLSNGLETFHQTENYFLVKYKQSNNANIFATINHPGETLNEVMKFTEFFIDRVLNKLGFQYYYFPFSTRFILKKARELKPDIISLHVIHGGYFKTSLIKKLSKIAPVVWTLHDMWPFTANGAHTFGDESWKQLRSGAGEKYIYPHIGFNRGKALLKRKKRIYKESNLHLVAPSHWLLELAKQSPLFAGKPLHFITHGIDLNMYLPKDKNACLRVLGLPENSKVIMFSSCDDLEKSPWKGGQLLKDILFMLDRNIDRRIEALVLGKGNLSGLDELNHIHINPQGYVNSEAFIRILLGAADVFIYPSKADSLGLVLVEALASGTPCITFSIGGCTDVIKDNVGGYAVEPFDTETFALKTIELLNNEDKLAELSAKGRKFVEEYFSLETIAGEYYNLFTALLEKEKRAD